MAAELLVEVPLRRPSFDRVLSFGFVD